MKKLNGLDKYVIFSILLLLLYTVAEFISSSVTGLSHDTLTTVYFACFGGEVLSCALIKIFKLRDEDKECDWREHDVSVADDGIDSTDL